MGKSRKILWVSLNFVAEIWKILLRLERNLRFDLHLIVTVKICSDVSLAHYNHNLNF